jgi:plasmid stability protein
MQYTIRQVPKALDRALRARAKSQGKSLNETTVEVLAEALGTKAMEQRRDLSDLVGSMTAADARAIEKSVAEMDRFDLRSQKRGQS